MADKDTLFNWFRSIADGEMALQIALVKLQGMLGYNEPLPDELIAETGQALAQLRASCTKLEAFLFTLGETPSEPS